MRFTLRATHPDVVWICGFEEGREDLVQGLRVRHPDAFLVVTGRGSTEGWGERVREAGADFTCGWPLPDSASPFAIFAPAAWGGRSSSS